MLSTAREHHIWTYEDYCRLPDDGQRYEIIDGRLYVTPAPMTPHQRVSYRLGLLLSPLDGDGVGAVFTAPTDLFLPGATPVQPDLFVLNADQLSFIHDDGVHGAPHLVIEILSTSTAAYDRTIKLRKYASSGVQHYWLVNWWDRTIEAFRLTPSGLYVLEASVGSGERLVSADFPAIAIDVDALFHGLSRTPPATGGKAGRGRRRRGPAPQQP